MGKVRKYSTKSFGRNQQWSDFPNAQPPVLLSRMISVAKDGIEAATVRSKGSFGL